VLRTSPSVLIVRLDALSDAVALVPLIHALASAQMPPSVVLLPQNAEIFSPQALQHIEVAHFALRNDTPANKRAIRAMGRSLAVRDYSAALIATEDPAGYRLARDAGIATRIGFENGLGKPLKTLWVRRLCTQTIRRSAGLDPKAPHECEVLFELVRPLLPAAIPSHDPALLRRYLIEGPRAPADAIAMQVTDKWMRIGATFDAVIQVARAIAKRSPARFVAAASESAFTQLFVEATHFEVESFASLQPWKAAIDSARAIVAPDSGAIHIAGMVGTPAVPVFAAQHFRVQSRRWSPWAAPFHAVRIEETWPLVALDALDELLSAAPVRTSALYKG